MSDPAPNIIQLSQPSVIEWIKTALTQTTIPPVTTVHMNGYSGRKDIEEALASLAGAHKVGGAKAAQTAWNEQVSKFIPDVAEIVNRPRYLYHADELKNLPPIRWLIEGEIPERGLTVLFGAPKSGKSFLALDYAERIGQRRPVVYIAAEGDSGYQYRHEAWRKHHKITDTKLYFWRRAVPMMRRTEVQYFVQEIQSLKPHLVIVDTLSRCMSGGDENSQQDMSTFIESCDYIRETLQCAVLVLHHTNKSGDIRGSSVLTGGADSVLELTNSEGTIKLAQSMVKDGKTIPSYYMRMIEIPLEPGMTSCVLMPHNLVKQDPDELTPNQQAIMTLLCGLYDRGARTSDLKGATNLGSTAFYEVLKSLHRRGLIDKDGRYDPWILTATGRALANKHGLAKG